MVPQRTGRLLLKTRDGDSVSELVSGESHFRKAGVEHNAVNANHDEFVFIEIEMKT